MGRPIKAKFFGNLNNEQYKHVGVTSGIGGEGVASISVSNTGTSYSRGTVVTFSAPDEPTGVTATGHPVFTANGNGTFGITSVVIDNAGSGYNTAPTLTVTTASGVLSVGNYGLTATNTFTVTTATGIAIGMLISGGSTGISGHVTAVNGNVITSTVNNNGTWSNSNNLWFWDFGTGFAKTVNLTSSQAYPAIKGNAFLPVAAGGASAVEYDIVKQEASRRYLVKTSQGIGQCKLATTSTLTAGFMNIIATDTFGSTYFVEKLTAHKAYLVQYQQGSAFAYSNNQAARWNVASASTGTVSIAYTI